MQRENSLRKEAWSFKQKVIWSEGMYLRPQHFQQMERYFEHYVQLRHAAAQSFYWGFIDYEVDADAAMLGKVALTSARGVMPDGTPFHFSNRDEAPTPLDIGPDSRDVPIVLALPLQRQGGEQNIFQEQTESLARYSVHSCEIADTNAVALGPAAVQVGRPRFRLAALPELGGDWQALGLLRVLERGSDHHLKFDRRYIPPVLSARVSEVLQAFILELHGLLGQRGEAMAERISQGGRGGVAEVADFLLLELINRSQAETWIAQELEQVHPEQLFGQWLRLAFDLGTYTTVERRPSLWPIYRHEDLQASFEPLIQELRRSLSTVLEQNAIAIPLEERAPRVWVGQIPSVDLIRQAGFVLAIHADAPAEVVRTRYPAQIKIGPVEQLNDLVHLHLPGVPIRILPVAPRQIPYHAGRHYFELDTSCELWRQLEKTAGLALHFAGDLPGLTMECWAIRG